MALFSKLKSLLSLETTSGSDEYLFEKYSDKKIYPTVSPEAVEEYNKQRDNGSHKILCSAPFKNLYFSRHGDVFVCCHSRDYAIGQYPQQSIIQIWNGEKIEQLRKYLTNLNFSLGCQICQADFDRKAYSEVRANHFDQLPLDIDFPTMMEFELDTTCNLECIMCSGEFSSSIRKNRENRPALTSPYDEKFVTELELFIPYLHETRFSGGEPFLVPLYLKMWNKIIETNPSCLISLQTNGTVMNEKIKAVLQKGRFEIGVSLDSMNKEIFESIRVNAKFEKVMDNIHFFSDYCRNKNTAFRLSMCVMRNNWKELPDYIRMCNRFNAYASFHKVINPESLALWNLSSSELYKINKHLEQFNFEGEVINKVSAANISHYKNYTRQIKLWADRSLQTEAEEKEWTNLPLNNMRQKFEIKLKNQILKLKTENDSSYEILNNFTALLDSFPQDKQQQLIFMLARYDINIVVQRLRLKSLEELKKEVSNLLPEIDD
jgi:sulfatase maturation enzyme AslB (radical SAM superfamily)